MFGRSIQPHTVVVLQWAAFAMIVIPCTVFAEGRVSSGVGSPEPRAISEAALICLFEPVGNDPLPDLGGRFRYRVRPVDSSWHVTSTLLLLDRQGQIWHEASIQDGDVVQAHLRDELLIKPMQNGVRWSIRSPGFIVRAVARLGFKEQVAYSSPFAAVRLDQPSNLVFATQSGTDPSVVQLTIAATHVDFESMRLTLNCVDLIGPVGAVLPGGPFSGDVLIDGEPVRVEELFADPSRGLLSLRLVGLRGGGHKLGVQARADYEDRLPPGAVHWRRPLGALENEQIVSVFQARITRPDRDATYPLAAIDVGVDVTHGLPIKGVRVQGVEVDTPLFSLIPGDSCHGPRYEIHADTILPLSELRQDFASGVDAFAAIDPGVNFVSAIAADSIGSTSNDRVRLIVGNAVEGTRGLAPGLGFPNIEGALSCGPLDSLAGFVTNGLAVGLSQRALNEIVKSKLIGKDGALCEAVTCGLKALEKKRLSLLFDPCSVPQEPRPPRCEPIPPSTPVAGNRPPIFSVVPDHSVDILGSIEFVLSAVDPDGDRVRFRFKDPLANAGICDSLFAFGPFCDQVGSHLVTIVADDGRGGTAERTATITVDDRDVDFFLDPEIKEVRVHPEQFDVTATIVEDQQIAITFRSGEVEFVFEDEDCWIDTFIFGCWLGWHASGTLSVDDIAVTYLIPADSLLCGTTVAQTASSVVLEGAQANDVAIGIDGWLWWFSTAGIGPLMQELFSVGIEAVADVYLLPKYDEALGDLFVGVVPGVPPFPSLLEFEPSGNVGSVPVSFDSRKSYRAVLAPGVGMSMGLHTVFEPLQNSGSACCTDQVPAWIATPSGIPRVGDTEADIMFQLSDDAMNQMLAALVSTGEFQRNLDGFTIDAVLDSLPPLLASMGVTLDTPITLAIDNVQSTARDTCWAIPPFAAIQDDPATPGRVELVVRTQLLISGVLPRDGTFADARCTCKCWDRRPECEGAPCTLVDKLYRLNWLCDARLVEREDAAFAIELMVNEVQEVVRKTGGHVQEAVDFSDQADSVVATSEKDELLRLFKDRANENLPSVGIPTAALTFRGLLPAPSKPRLKAMRVAGAGVGTEDYLGIVADITQRTFSCDPSVAFACSSSGGSASARARTPTIRNPSPARPLADRQSRVATGLEVMGPNPLRVTTAFRLSLPRPSEFGLRIYDVSGRVVRGFKGSGSGDFIVEWDGRDEAGRKVSRGVYFCALKADGVHDVKTVVVLR